MTHQWKTYTSLRMVSWRFFTQTNNKSRSSKELFLCWYSHKLIEIQIPTTPLPRPNYLIVYSWPSSSSLAMQVQCDQHRIAPGMGFAVINQVVSSPFLQQGVATTQEQQQLSQQHGPTGGGATTVRPRIVRVGGTMKPKVALGAKARSALQDAVWC